MQRLMKSKFDEMMEGARQHFKNPPKELSQKKILILDDEPYNIEAIKAMYGLLQLNSFPDSLDTSYEASDALELI